MRGEPQERFRYAGSRRAEEQSAGDERADQSDQSSSRQTTGSEGDDKAHERREYKKRADDEPDAANETFKSKVKNSLH
jgi:hypothetical protein